MVFQKTEIWWASWGLSHLLFIANVDFYPCVIDPCLSNPCEHGGDCLVSGDTFTCSCPSPFSGKRCQNGECIFTRLTLPSELNKRQVLLQLQEVKRGWVSSRKGHSHALCVMPNGFLSLDINSISLYPHPCMLNRISMSNLQMRTLRPREDRSWTLTKMYPKFRIICCCWEECLE